MQNGLYHNHCQDFFLKFTNFLLNHQIALSGIMFLNISEALMILPNSQGFFYLQLFDLVSSLFPEAWEPLSSYFKTPNFGCRIVSK